MALYGGLVGAAPLGGSRGTHLPLLKTALQQKKPAALRILPMSLRSGSSSFVDLGRLRFEAVELTNRGRLSGGALSSKCSVVLSMETLRWVFTVSALVLMVAKNTGVRKSFLVPLLALEAPAEVVSWIRWVGAISHVNYACEEGSHLLPLLMMMCLPCGRGDYGLWTAFLVFLVRLFYSIPGGFKLKTLNNLDADIHSLFFFFHQRRNNYLLGFRRVGVASAISVACYYFSLPSTELEASLLILGLFMFPYVMNASDKALLFCRGTQAGMVISIAVAAYLAFQHFSRAGGLKKALDQETVVPTVAAVFLVTVPLLFLIQGFIF